MHFPFLVYLFALLYIPSDEPVLRNKTSVDSVDSVDFVDNLNLIAREFDGKCLAPSPVQLFIERHPFAPNFPDFHHLSNSSSSESFIEAFQRLEFQALLKSVNRLQSSTEFDTEHINFLDSLLQFDESHYFVDLDISLLITLVASKLKTLTATIDTADYFKHNAALYYQHPKQEMKRNQETYDRFKQSFPNIKIVKGINDKIVKALTNPETLEERRFFWITFAAQLDVGKDCDQHNWFIVSKFYSAFLINQLRFPRETRDFIDQFGFERGIGAVRNNFWGILGYFGRLERFQEEALRCNHLPTAQRLAYMNY